jgi:MerR family transcriptional regulator, thiopeptide resistance regulator
MEVGVSADTMSRYPPLMDNEFTDVIPLLACSDIAAEHDFLVTVLGFTSAGLERMPDGTVVHGEVRAGSHRIWLHRTDDAGNLVPPGPRGPAGGGIVVHVRDVDAHHRRVRAAGADVLSEPRDQDYGQREYGVRDPEGHLWWMATPVQPPADG